MSCRYEQSSSLTPLLLMGLDSLYVSFYLDTESCDIDWDELEYLKGRVGQSRNDTFSEVGLGSETFALMPFGRNKYKFVLDNRAFKVCLSEHMKPSCYVQFYSEALWKYGLDALTERFQEWRCSVNLSATASEKVSRADWAFDYHLPDIDFLPEHFISRAAKDATWREYNALQTIQLGQGQIVIRVYDKSAEIAQKSGKSWFFELWKRQDQVWRVEFQVRGDRLREGGIITIDGLKLIQADILRELATNHTTLRIPNADSNRSRWSLHPLWQSLLKDIAALPQTGLIRAIDPQKALDWRLYQQKKSLYGHLKGIGAILTLQADNDNEPILFDQLMERLPKLLSSQHNNPEWEREIKRRATAYRLGKW